jgi:hypothetical protein
MAGIPLVLGFHFDAWERACLFLVHSPHQPGPIFCNAPPFWESCPHHLSP